MNNMREPDGFLKVVILVLWRLDPFFLLMLFQKTAIT